jgi:hypothetical protein
MPQAVQILLCLVAADLVLEGFDPLSPLQIINLLSLTQGVALHLDPV